VLRGLGRRAASTNDTPDVVEVGVGMAAAAAHTARALAAGPGYQGVANLGIGGAFGGRAALGGVVVGALTVAADLGADSPGGFVSLAGLGFGPTAWAADGALLARLRAALPTAVTGEILTVSTVTGTAARAAELAARHPDAVAEAMEGFGVATAAAAESVPFIEVRTISNLIGPRDRGAWRIDAALGALAEVAAALGTLVE
jgi:futalosine hydrolase